jgi:hypothetical protein
MVARKLDSRLRDHMASSRGVNAFSGHGSEGSFGRSCKSAWLGDCDLGARTPLQITALRPVEFHSPLWLTLISGARVKTTSQIPVLVILDRNVDLVPMLSHSWTYQALVNDVLGMKLNRVTVEVRTKTSQEDRDGEG